jgi:hypothetical protein
MNIAPDSERTSGDPPEREFDDIATSIDSENEQTQHRQSTGNSRENQAAHRGLAGGPAP